MSSSATLYSPRPYQKLAQHWLLDRPKAALFMDVGLGKSVVALNHVAYTRAVDEVNRWLVVAPLRVCQTTWPQELEKWADSKAESITIQRQDRGDVVYLERMPNQSTDNWYFNLYFVSSKRIN